MEIQYISKVSALLKAPDTVRISEEFFIRSIVSEGTIFTPM